MLPPSGAAHRFPIIDISKYYNPNVLRVIGDYPRRTPVSHLHSTLLLEPIHKFIYRLTENFFSQLFHTPQPACLPNRNLIFVVPCIMLYNCEISPTRCNNCVLFFAMVLFAYLRHTPVSHLHSTLLLEPIHKFIA